MLGGSYFTGGENFLYLVQTDRENGAALLPVVKTATQRRSVLARFAELGVVPDGERMIVDGDAFVAVMPREVDAARGDDRRTAIAVDFVLRGQAMVCTTVHLGFSPEATLAKWRAEDVLR